MRTPTFRVSRGIRTRLAKRRGMRIPRRIEIDRKGLIIEGQRFPYWVSANLGIRRFRNAAILSLDILADEVTVRGPLSKHATITETWA